MDFDFTPEEEAFRTELRAFLDDELPTWWKTVFVDDARAMPFTRELCGKLADQSVGIGRHAIRRLDHQPLQRPAVRGDSLLQALLHPLYDQGIIFHARDGVGALARGQG